MEDPSTIISSVPISAVVHLAFYLLLGCYCIFSAILYYHWDTYATDNGVSRFTLLTYISLSLPLILLMGIMLFII